MAITMLLLFTNLKDIRAVCAITPVWCDSVFARVYNIYSFLVPQLGHNTSKPRRLRRGVNLLFVSIMMFVFIVTLNLFMQQRIQAERNARAGEIVDHITALATDLDFWVHNNQAQALNMLTLTNLVNINTTNTSHPINASVTAAPYVSRARANWSISYSIVTLPGEAQPYGVIIARPTSPQSQSLSSKVAVKVTERTRSSQSNTTSSTDYLRNILTTAGHTLVDHDLVFFSYSFNNLNPNYVLRQKFAGIPTPVMESDLLLGTATPSSHRNLINVDEAFIASADVGAVRNVTGSTIYSDTISTQTKRFGKTTVQGDLNTQNFTQNTTGPLNLRANAITVNAATTANHIQAAAASSIKVLTTGTLSVTSVMTSKTQMNVPNVTTDQLVFEQYTLTGSLAKTAAQADFLTSAQINAATVNTGSCTGC